MSNDELTACVRVASQGEAQALALILDEEEIPYRERPYHDTAFDGLGLMLNQQVGWGELWVRAADEGRVTEALAALRDAPEAPLPEEADDDGDGAAPDGAADGAAPDRAADGAAPDARGDAAVARAGGRRLWLLLAVLGAVLLIVIVASLLGDPDPCKDVKDPYQREQCQQQHARPRPQAGWPWN